MISRRALAAALTKTGLFSLASTRNENRNIESAAHVMSADSFESIKRLAPPESVSRIETAGYTYPGVGAATYIGVASGQSSRSCVRTANNRWFELSPVDIYVEKFGALGNASSHDDYPAVAAAVEYLEARGGGVLRCQGFKTYYLSDTIKINPTLTSIDAEGATWSFTKTDADEGTRTNLLRNGDFSAGTANWIKAPGAAWQFGGGKAIHDALPQSSGMSIFAQKVAGLGAGDRVLVSLVLESLEAPAHLSVGLVAGADVPAHLFPGCVEVFEAAGIYHFSLVSPGSTQPIWLTVATQGKVKIDFIGVQKDRVNACVEVSAGAGSSNYGQARHYCRGLRVEGSQPGLNLLDGIYFNTEVPANSSRWALYSCEFSTNLRRALVLGNRAYLLQAHSCRFSGVWSCVDTIANSQDAGESIDFFGCTFDNGGVGICNPAGMEIKLFGGAIDYCQHFYVGAGEMTLVGTHLEMGEPRSALQIPIVLTGPGDFRMDGGTLLITPTGKNDYVFFGADRFSRVILQDVAGYGWPSARGELMGGNGRLLIDRVWWGPNHQIAPVPKRDFLHSLFGAAGGFEGNQLDVCCAVVSAAGANDGPHWSRDATSKETYFARLELSSERARTGRRALKITKQGWGTGTETTILILGPIDRRRLISCEFSYNVSLAPGTIAAGNVWFTLSFCQLAGFDEQRVPIIAATENCQEHTLVVGKGSNPTEWTSVGLSSTYADQTSPSDGYGPDWATHMLIAINLVEAPSGFSLYIDDLYGFCF